MPLPHSFASFLHAKSSQNKVNFRTLEMEQSDLADVLIPISLSPSSKLSKEELSFVPVWIKFHGVPILAFTADGLSVIATRLGTSVMLYSCTVTKCMQSWERMDYARALVNIRVDRDLKSIMVIYVPNPIGNGVTKHTIKEDNEKPMDGLVDDTRKKVDAPSRKIDVSIRDNSCSSSSPSVHTGVTDLSILGHKNAIHLFTIGGWLLVVVTLVLCGVFVILNNFYSALAYGYFGSVLGAQVLLFVRFVVVALLYALNEIYWLLYGCYCQYCLAMMIGICVTVAKISLPMLVFWRGRNPIGYVKSYMNVTAN
nr:hypothetical protein [Tanacetum cinerariifolium]